MSDCYACGEFDGKHGIGCLVEALAASQARVAESEAESAAKDAALKMEREWTSALVKDNGALIEQLDDVATALGGGSGADVPGCRSGRTHRRRSDYFTAFATP